MTGVFLFVVAVPALLVVVHYCRRSRPDELVVGTSTGPVGTVAEYAGMLAAKVLGSTLARNPESLREGFAVEDTLHPDRLVHGVPAGAEG